MSDITVLPLVETTVKPSGGYFLPLFSIFVHPTVQQGVAQALVSTFLSESKLVKEFEARLSAELGMAHPASINSGTSALHLALNVAGIGPGDKVILASQTFITSVLTVVQVGPKPVLADIQYETGNLDPSDIEQRIIPRTKAIMAVHWDGYPCDLAEIQAIADRQGLVVIEDAAHSPRATYRGQPIGSISDYSCFSFQAIKQLTTGDGGTLYARDPEKVGEVFRRRWFGIDRANSSISELDERNYDLTDVGYKYHFSDFAAMLGVVPSLYYAWRHASAAGAGGTSEPVWETEILAVFDHHKRHYGTRHHEVELREKGHRVGHQALRTGQCRHGRLALQPKAFAPRTIGLAHG